MTKEIERVRTYTPHVDVVENDENIIITTDVPGVDENAIDITLEKNVLSVQGQISANSPEGYTLAYAEYETGHYQRNFTLSNLIDQENIKAVVKDGILNVTLPKTAPVQAKKIAVQAA